ncbi:MAG TPA: GNAT family N-acetyltransferase [Silvibacterium sp.]|jgi:GNAT superfamily N-acetyltransferase|nr:GNAT family N-acetyltransferase [Silvibacterium sp.]
MPALEPITTKNVRAFKAVRLWALRDSPTAFGSTYARESQFGDIDWLKRVANMSGEKGIGYLAMDDGLACGIVGALLDQHDSRTAQVVSMWVAPAYRRNGTGSVLIDAIQKWARARGVRTLCLMVTGCNHGAIEFYKNSGFSLTGITEPYPNDPSMIEYEMSQPVAAEEQ